MSELLVLGAGFGGITTALELRKRLPSTHRVTLVDQRSDFLMGLAHLWALDGRRTLDAGRRPLEPLRRQGIELVRGRVKRIDVERRSVIVAGASLRYDVLVIALGAELAPQALPGFEAAHNLYAESSLPSLTKALEDWSGGRLLVSIASLPFKCPPAPYEAALLLDALLERRGVRRSTSLEFTTPEPHPLPVAPPFYGQTIQKLLEERRIAYHPNQKPRAIRGDAREIEYEDGTKRSYDLLVAVPPHRAPEAARAAGLTDASGWIPVDRHTLRTVHPNVYAVGDVATMKLPNGKPLPKAGVLAEAQGKVVAANVAAQLQGRPADATFSGQGLCFVEVGNGHAIPLQGDFFAVPEPRFTEGRAGPEGLREKQRFEAERLAAWFGE